MLKGQNDEAIEELLQTIWKANGYLHEDLKDDVQEIHQHIWSQKV